MLGRGLVSDLFSGARSVPRSGGNNEIDLGTCFIVCLVCWKQETVDTRQVEQSPRQRPDCTRIFELRERYESRLCVIQF